MSTEASETIELPDGTVFSVPEFGDQMPRLWTAPPRHIEPAEDCASCALDVHPTGCGEYMAQELIPWAGAYGYELDPWQDWSIRNITGLRPNGRWAAGTNCIIVTRQNGKGTILEVRELGGLYLTGEEFLIHTAHEFKTSVKHFNRLKYTINQYSALRKRVKRIAGSHGEESIELRATPTYIWGSGGRQVLKSISPVLAFLARSRGSGRGFSCDCLVYDEDMILTAEQVGASLPTMSARRNPQTIYAGSAALEDSEQEGKLYLRIKSGDRKMFGALWGIDPHTDDCPRDEARGRRTNGYIVCSQHDDRDNPASWAKANPGFGYRINAEFTLNEELLNMPDGEFDRERLGVGAWPSEEDPWLVVSEEAWGKLANENPGFPVRPIAFAGDIDEDGKSATVTAGWLHGTGRTVIEIPREGSRLGSGWLLEKMDELYRKWHPVAMGLPKQGPGAALLEDGKKRWRDRLVPLGSAEEAAAFAWFLQQIRDEKIWHFGKAQASTLWHAIGRADVRVVGDGGKAWSRRDSESDITPVTSATNVAYILNKMARNYDLMASIG